MNKERLNKIIDSYIDHFDMLTNEDCDENMKWRAIYHFKENFDINAADFHEMFQCAMSKSSIIINNGTVQPVNGILKLITHEESTMRSLFAALYADDNGDLDKRQNKIEHFVEETNKLLEKYERGKWKYKQDFRSVLAYLTFYKPEENYLYKASQCQPFFRYLEYGEELGYGQYFRLSRYYRMCDEIKNSIAEHPALIETHNKRWSTVNDPQDDLHILTFDLIYCSIVYEFYEFKHYTKIIRKSKADLEQERLQDEIEDKKTELDTLETELSAAQTLLDGMPELNLEGQSVRHKTFGVGTVVKQNGSYITVEFSAKTTRFISTMAFASGYLSSEDPSIFQTCKQLEEMLEAIDRIEKTIKRKQTELGLLLSKLK